MKTYGVTLPITGIIYVEVEAGSEKDAIQAAIESDFDTSNIESWTAHRQIVEGNVFHGEQNKAEAEYLGGDEEDEA